MSSSAAVNSTPSSSIWSLFSWGSSVSTPSEESIHATVKEQLETSLNRIPQEFRQHLIGDLQLHEWLENNADSKLKSYIINIYRDTKEQIEKDPTKRDLLISAARENIACAIFVENNKESMELSFLDNGLSKEQITQQLKILTQSHLKMVHNQLAATQAKEQEIGLINSRVYIQNATPIEVAKLLVTKQGFINFGLIELLKAEFTPKELGNSTPPAYLSYLKFNLNKLVDTVYNPSIERMAQCAFAMIQPPLDDNDRSEWLIRATLNLGDEEITRTHALITVLSGILTKNEQTYTGTCFTECVIDKTEQERLIITLIDYAQLIHRGALYRSVEGVNTAFTFIPQANNPSIYNEVYILKDGTFIHNLEQDTSQELTDCIALAAAFKQMGIHEKHLPDFKAHLANTFATNPVKKVSILEILQEAAEFRGTIPILVEIELEIGMYAFAGSHDSLIHRALISAAAPMMESVNNNFINKISRSLELVFDFCLEQDSPIEIENEKCDEIKQALMRGLALKVQMQYENVGNIREECLDRSGQFTLYERDLDATLENPTTGTRINDPQEFGLFLQNICDFILDDDNEFDQNQKVIITLFKSYLGTTQYLTTAFYGYNPLAFVEAITLDRWTESKHTPWRECSGGIPEDVAKVYWNLDNPIQWTTYRPSTDADLLRFQINEIWKWQQSTNFIYNEQASRYVFVQHPGHVFNCDLKQPSLLRFVSVLKDEKSNDIDAAINKIFIEPCKTVGDTPIEETTKKEIFKVANTLAKRCFDTEINGEEFQKTASSPSIHSYANSLQQFTFTQHPLATNKKKKEFENSFSAAIIDALPEAEQKIMKDAIVHRAYSNWPDIWSDTPKQIHFCSYYDLVSGNVMSGMVDGDNTNLQHMDMPTYVKYTAMNIKEMPLPNRFALPIKA